MICPDCGHENAGEPTHCRACKSRMRDGDSVSGSDKCEDCDERWTHQIAGRRVCVRCYDAERLRRPDVLSDLERMMLEGARNAGRPSREQMRQVVQSMSVPARTVAQPQRPRRPKLRFRADGSVDLSNIEWTE